MGFADSRCGCDAVVVTGFVCALHHRQCSEGIGTRVDAAAQVWSVGQPTPNFTLEGHEKGVNCVDYFVGGAQRDPTSDLQAESMTISAICQGSYPSHALLHRATASGAHGNAMADSVARELPHVGQHRAAGDRPFLLSGADDRLAKVWDYQTKACVQTLEGHAHNVSAVMFHPELPVILTGCAITPPVCCDPAMHLQRGRCLRKTMLPHVLLSTAVPCKPHYAVGCPSFCRVDRGTLAQ